MLQSMWFIPLGGAEIFVILAIVLLLFGGKKIPELMRGLGKGIKEFNSARGSVEGEAHNEIHEDRTVTEKRKIED